MALVIGVVVAGFVILAIIGILAAIAIPNLLTALERSKQKRTMADIRSIATALEAYGTDHSQEEYPPGEYVESLRAHLEPTYIRHLPVLDGWGTAIRYSPLPNHGYVIVSAGKNRTFEADSPDQYTRGSTQNYDCDIVYSNNEFVQHPEGIQSMGGR